MLKVQLAGGVRRPGSQAGRGIHVDKVGYILHAGLIDARGVGMESRLCNLYLESGSYPQVPESLVLKNRIGLGADMIRPIRRHRPVLGVSYVPPMSGSDLDMDVWQAKSLGAQSPIFKAIRPYVYAVPHLQPKNAVKNVPVARDGFETRVLLHM